MRWETHICQNPGGCFRGGSFALFSPSPLPWQRGNPFTIPFFLFSSAPLPPSPAQKLSCFRRQTVGLAPPSRDSVVKIQCFVLRPSCKTLPLWETVKIDVLVYYFFNSFFFGDKWVKRCLQDVGPVELGSLLSPGLGRVPMCREAGCCVPPGDVT